ncbi:hypothetical protein ILUMI_16874, partial [Ignelater luminosus]
MGYNGSNRKREERTLSEKVALLKADILNGPSHIFGEHKNCSSYFYKDVNTTTSSTLSDIKLTSLYDKLMSYVRLIAHHANSLIFDVENNCVEQFNSILAKHTGGKRINYCMRRSFVGRSFASVISYNTKIHFMPYETKLEARMTKTNWGTLHK